MLQRAILIAPASLVLVALAQLAAGCKATGPEKAEATVSSMSELERALRDTGRTTAVTLDALDKLVSHPDADLRPPYDTFTTALSGLASNAKAVGRGAESMKERAQRYFGDWEKSQASIQSKDIRKRSEERRAHMLVRQQQVNGRVDAFARRLETFVTRIEDIHAFLGHDLNRGGISAISDEAKQTAGEGAKIQEALDELLTRLVDLRTSLSAQGPETPE